MPEGPEEKGHIFVMKAFAKTKDKIKASFCACNMNELGCAVLEKTDVAMFWFMWRFATLKIVASKTF